MEKQQGSKVNSLKIFLVKYIPPPPLPNSGRNKFNFLEKAAPFQLISIKAKRGPIIYKI